MNETTYCPRCWDRIVGLKAWMMRHRISQVRIAYELGVTDTLVWRTIHGYERNPRVMDWFRRHGCPEGLLPPMRPEGRDAA
jgi:hypothetical protein